MWRCKLEYIERECIVGLPNLMWQNSGHNRLFFYVLAAGLAELLLLAK